jgi:RNA polymerase sigma-70 factor (ECF subfamily)
MGNRDSCGVGATKEMSADPSRKLLDESLLSRALEDPDGRGGKEAIAELFRHYRGHIYQWCFRYVQDQEQALDLSQEVMLEAYKSLKSYRGRASFSTWLFAITRNRCVNVLRRRSRMEVADVDPDLLEDPRLDPSEDLEKREDEEQVLRMIRENLHPREQEAICLRIFERMPVETITQILGIEGSSGARSILQSARRKLRAAAARLAEAQGEDKNA